jgi:hypothetical protein
MGGPKSGILTARRASAENSVESEASSWKEFSSRDGGFAIKFPGSPKTETQTVGGQFTLNIFRLHTFAEYSVMYADYPNSVNDSDPTLAREILDNGLAGAIAEVNSSLLEVAEVSIENHPGRRYKERMRDGSILWGQTYLAGHRLYQIAITTPKVESAEAGEAEFYQSVARRFLGSFRLLAH